VGIVASGLAVLIGTFIGVTAGFFGGWADTTLSRGADVMLAIPQLLISIGIVAACSTTKEGCAGGLIKPGLSIVIAVIVLFSWPYVARVVRGNTLSLREKEFVEAARMTGASDFRIMRSHLLPHLVAPIIVYSSILVAANILAEAGLSFIGLGIVPPTASWGNLLANAATYYQTDVWILLLPGMAILLTTIAFNLLGDGLRDAFDPRSRI
jgi:peptide/nickel transport system permease protein